MIDTDDISRKDFQSYVLHKFPDGNHKGDEWNIQCPRCHNEKRRASINLKNGRANCYHCHWGAGGWLDLVAAIEGLPGPGSAEKWFRENLGNFNVFVYDGIDVAHAARVPMLRQLPREYEGILVDYPDVPGAVVTPPSVARPFIDYLKKRGFDPYDIWQYNVGYCTRGYYAGRVIFPVVNDGILEFFVDRSIEDDAERKTLGIGGRKEYWPVDKGYVIWNLSDAVEYARNDNHLKIAEGIFTAHSLGKNCVALLGKKATDAQIKRLLDTGIEEFEVCLDAGAEKEAYQLCSTLASWGRRVYIREFKEVVINGRKLTDANDYEMFGIDLPEPEDWSGKHVLHMHMKGWAKKDE